MIMPWDERLNWSFLGDYLDEDLAELASDPQENPIPQLLGAFSALAMSQIHCLRSAKEVERACENAFSIFYRSALGRDPSPQEWEEFKSSFEEVWDEIAPLSAELGNPISPFLDHVGELEGPEGEEPIP